MIDALLLAVAPTDYWKPRMAPSWEEIVGRSFHEATPRWDYRNGWENPVDHSPGCWRAKTYPHEWRYSEQCMVDEALPLIETRSAERYDATDG